MALCGSGSNRRYFRIRGGECTAIGVLGMDREENRAFVSLARDFRRAGLNVPEVYAVAQDYAAYIQEDLGDVLLSDMVSRARKSGDYAPLKPLLEDVVRALPHFQFAEGVHPEVCFDSRRIFYDLNYFKYCFLKPAGLEFDENALQDDFERLCDDLLACDDMDPAFLYRDFQSRNVMVKDGKPWFIDFQGGRKGPIYYDLASFVWQAKANYSEELKRVLIETYREELKNYISIEDGLFYDKLRHFVLFRTMQVLGAYGFRGYFEKKPHFLQSVPFAIDNLRKLIKSKPFYEYPYLQELLTELTNMRQFNDIAKERQLEVRIFSFAYKKGIPSDTSGNGGGYVFDCRAIENPGKYDHYKHFIGTDKEVVDFLEADGGVLKFLDNVYALADAHVQRYIQRKFTNLMFSFGCTGGQHRSVYCAQHLAEHIAQKFNVKVILYHREQDIEQIF